MSGFEDLLESLVPGSSGQSMLDSDGPPFPRDLGLEPRSVIGRGGVGWVYRAHDPVLDREVAVKISRPEGGAKAREAMLAEARTTCRIHHPAVLPVHRIVASGGLLCIEFQLAPVTTLAVRLDEERQATEGSWSVEERLHVLLIVISALRRAHELGITHGDLHPANIALGGTDEPYVLDWSGLDDHDDGSFSGSAGYAAPEQLRGEAPTPASDVHALGALIYEVVSLVPLRPRKVGEPLSVFIARWRDARASRLGDRMQVEPALDELVARCLDADPSARPSAQELWETLGTVLSGGAERRRREDEANERVSRAHAAVTRFRQLGRRLGQERQVLAMQQAKIPGWAPAAQKRPLWDAEDRVATLADERERAWSEALQQAQTATRLAPNATRAHELLAELWWLALERAETHLDKPAARRAEELVRHWDDGRYTAMLAAKGTVELSTDASGATVRVHRWAVTERHLVPEAVGQAEALPAELELDPGSWLLILSAPGRVDVRLPIQIGRGDQFSEHVPMFTPEQAGEGWVQVPAGSFVMGGDRLARMAVERCEPWLDTFFIRETCITSTEWLTFLNDLSADEAAEHVPGEMGFFGGSTAFWPREGGQYVLPEGWPPTLPAIGLNLADIHRYAAWRSEREGRQVRLPSEEEWEKAARGVDGRLYPWGDHFDPTFGHMRRSIPDKPQPVPVGLYPVDCSPYGVRDMAGGVREWTDSIFDQGQMVIRGGTFGDDADDLRCAGRSGFQPEFKFSFVGFRLVAVGARS